MLKRTSMALVVLMLLALVAGCSKAPEAEMTAASTAIEAARTAEAEIYAPDAFQKAQDSLNAAAAMKTEQDNKFALFRSYGKSKEAYVRAQALASDAAAAAETRKEEVKQEVMGLMTQARAAIDTAMVVLSKAPKGKDTKAELEMIKMDLDGLNPAYAEAEADFTNGKYMTAKTKFEGVIQRANDIINEINNAAMKKAG